LNNLLKSLFILSLASLAACSPEPSAPVDTKNKADTQSGDLGTAAEAPAITDDATANVIENVIENVAENVTETTESRPADWRQHLSKPDLMRFEDGKTYYWDMKTNKGDMRFRLFHETAPMHTTSTIYLTNQGFYDNLTFHRVIPGFMAQGGDPTGTGAGDPGYRYEGEFAGNLSHDKPGLLSMANAGPGTDGSQFFITFVPTPFLNGKHTLFGELVSGMDTLKALEAKGSRAGTTMERLEIASATITVE
jgi:cyclophilin family peptidyl-prolyl cis-trans isomerase